MCVRDFSNQLQYTSLVFLIFSTRKCVRLLPFHLLQLEVVNSFSEDSSPGSYKDKKTTTMEEADGILAPSSAKEPGNQSSSHSPTEVDFHGELNLNVPVTESMGKRKLTNQSNRAPCDSTLPSDDSQNSCKKLKSISDDAVTAIRDYSENLNLGAFDESKHIITCVTSDKSVEHGEHVNDEHDKSVGDGPKAVRNETEFKLSNSMERRVVGMLSLSGWKPIEKELYLKGVEMFGRNRYGAFCVSPHTMLRNARIVIHLV